MTRLEEVPVRMDRLESQIVQFRTDVRGEFSAVRTDISAVDEALRREMQEGFSTLRAEIRGGDEGIRRELRDGLATVRLETRAGDEETRSYMRLLFEEYVGRLKVVAEKDTPDT